MASGPGKYDDLATFAMVKARAQAVIVIVVEGNRGSGFSAQTCGPTVAHMLPSLLRHMANQIECDNEEVPHAQSHSQD